MNRFINQMEPWFGSEETQAVIEYMNSGGWITEFEKTKEFENKIADFTKSKHCIVVNNGTISLTLMALASGIEPGDEIIVPNYTMIATPNSIKMIGAIPVFVDVEPETLCLDFEKVKKSITPKTKAILFMNANGRYPKAGIEKFINLSNEKGIILLEDSAQALGSFYKDKSHIGTKGLAGSFSFSAPKIISTGQGGAIITNDDEFAFRLRRLKDFGRSGGGNDIHDSIGFNFKFTELQAVIGLEQMKKLDYRIKRKQDIYSRYKKNLKDLNEIKFFEQDLENTTPWFIDIQAEKRDKLIIYLKNKGIGTRVMYPPINEQKAYSLKGSFPVSKKIGEKGLWLPSSTQISDLEIDFITNEIIKFYINEK